MTRPAMMGFTAVAALLALEAAADPAELRDQLLGYGTVPLSVVEWLMFDDDSSLAQALQ